MVVILLLPPYSTNGCDGRSNESSSTATSTTSTGETAIPTNNYNQQPHTINNKNNQNKLLEDFNNNNQQTSSYYYAVPPPEPPTGFFQYTENFNPQHSFTALQENTSHYRYTAVSPPPPPLPKTKPPNYVAERVQFHKHSNNATSVIDQRPSSNVKICANIVPKPPRCRSQSYPTLATIPEHTIQQPAKEKQANNQQPPITVPASSTTSPSTVSFYKSNSNYLLPSTKAKSNSKSKSSKNSNYVTNTTNYVRHVTRVNFYDIDTSQVEYEYESKDNDVDDNHNLTLDDENNTEALTKEGKLRIFTF